MVNLALKSAGSEIAARIWPTHTFICGYRFHLIVPRRIPHVLWFRNGNRSAPRHKAQGAGIAARNEIIRCIGAAGGKLKEKSKCSC